MRKFKLLALLCDCAAWFVSDLVGTPNCWFSHAQAQIILQPDQEILISEFQKLDQEILISEYPLVGN